MLNGKFVAVVIPCYDEEKQIGLVIETIPSFVDKIIVVNDCSTDATEAIVKQYIKDGAASSPYSNNVHKIIPNKYNKAELVLEEILEKEQSLYTPSLIFNKDPDKNRVVLINHLVNASVGASIATGYKWCLDHKIDCTAVMAGDGQMDPNELESICMPIVKEEVDYVKANRLKHRSALFVIPKIRFFGNSILSLFTKIASGYWRVSDSQTGYTAIGLKALSAIRIHQIFKSYGCPNDILVKLNIAFCTIKEVESKPVYKVGETSKMNELKVVPRISWLLFKCFWKRLYSKYLFRDFHPLFLLYHFAFLVMLINIPVAWNLTYKLLTTGYLPLQSLIVFVFLMVSGLQSLFFAMWMDMMDNERLQK